MSSAGGRFEAGDASDSGVVVLEFELVAEETAAGEFALFVDCCGSA